jgi:hypothetical protein
VKRDELVSLAAYFAEQHGHKLAPFAMLGDSLASSECTAPGCNMGCTVDAAADVSTVLGSAIVFDCPMRAHNA